MEDRHSTTDHCQKIILNPPFNKWFTANLKYGSIERTKTSTLHDLKAESLFFIGSKLERLVCSNLKCFNPQTQNHAKQMTATNWTESQGKFCNLNVWYID